MDHHQPGTRSFISRRSPVFGSVPCESPMRLFISSTTGSRFELSVPQGETLEGLRRRLSQKLRVPKDRLVFLHKETQLNAGKLLDQGVADGSKLTLVPAVEAGLTPQSPRSEQTMMQALESLTETQVSDFLSGRSPLTLALGIGAHMMYVQLQLASQNVVGQQQAHVGSRSGGKVHSGKTGSSRVSRPYPSPSHPLTNTPPSGQREPPVPLSFPTQSQTYYKSHTVSPTQHKPQTAPPVSCSPHTSQPHAGHPSHTSSPASSAPSVSSCSPLPGSPLLPAAPLCSPHPSCSSPGPQSPTPAATYPEETCLHPSPQKLSREAGAVIESFVSHSPGVFSGTFSGTLPPVSQNGISHPRRGIATILQILNDLLSATRHHQGAPASLSQLRSPAPASPPSSSSPFSPTSLLSQDPPTSTTATSGPANITSSQVPEPQPQLRHGLSSKLTGNSGCLQQLSSLEENRVLRRKLERLQLLMHQRRLRRRARRDTHSSSHASHPYAHRHRHPWSPGQRKAARRHSNSSLSGSEGTSQDDLEVEEIMEESPWKPDMTSDLVVV